VVDFRFSFEELVFLFLLNDGFLLELDVALLVKLLEDSIFLLLEGTFHLVFLLLRDQFGLE